MRSRSARGAAVVTAIVAAAVTGAAVPAMSATPVHIDANEVFVEGGVSTFVSTIEGCESGTVATLRNQLGGSRQFGIFNGFKLFECSDGGSFAVRLQAKFGEFGSVGTWAITGGDGGFEGLAGSGTLVGTPTSTGINDVYDGTLRP